MTRGRVTAEKGITWSIVRCKHRHAAVANALHFPEPSLLRLWKQSRCFNNCAVNRKRQLGTRYLSRAAYIFDPYAKYRMVLIRGTQQTWFAAGSRPAQLGVGLVGVSFGERLVFCLRNSSA